MMGWTASMARMCPHHRKILPSRNIDPARPLQDALIRFPLNPLCGLVSHAAGHVLSET